MVQLLIQSPSGNSGSRYYPHTGYLGLTPCTIQGIVRVKLDEDTKPLSAKVLTVAVRCYESRLGKLNALQTNMVVEYPLTLWSKPDHLPSLDISQLDHPFKITIPVDSPGFSTANFQEYKVSWRVEAVLEHIPLVGVGNRLIKHYELPFIRYDSPGVPTAPRLSSSNPISLHSAKLRAPILRYNLSTPTQPIGPDDIVSTCIYIHPIDPLVTIRSASLTIERRLNLHNQPSRNKPSSPVQSHSPYQEAHPSAIGLLTPSASSSRDDSYNDPDSNLTIRPLPPPSPIQSMESSKTITNTILSAEAIDFSRDTSGMWSKSVTLMWPSRKKHSWATGETLRSDIAKVQFFIRIRLYVSSPNSGTESIELDERELTVVSTNDAERRLALAQYTEQLATSGRSNSKSPRRSRREAATQLPSPPQSPVSSTTTPLSAGHNHKPSTSSSSKTRPRSSRRPHTSAGPRDKSNLPYSAQPEVGLRSNPTVKVHIVHTSKKTESHRDYSSSRSGRPSNNEIHHVHRSYTDPAEMDHPTRARVPSNHVRDWEAELARIESESKTTAKTVRDWEAELARIESQSRRSSADMLGFGGSKRKRAEPSERIHSL